MNPPTRFISRRRGNHGKSGSKDEESERKHRDSSRRSLNVSDIFQFSAARKRAFERDTKIRHEKLLKIFLPNRVFINHMDSFNGKALVNNLSQQLISIPRRESHPEEDDELMAAEESTLTDIPGEDYEDFSKSNDRDVLRKSIEIIGTVDYMKKQNFKTPDAIREIVDCTKREDFMSRILTCGFIIYDISDTLNCHPFQIEEATMVLSNIINHLEDFQSRAPSLFAKYNECRTFILISTLMTWAKTKPIDPDNPGLPFTERDYRKRKPHPNYKIHNDFEKRVLEMGKKFPKNLRTIVIGSGITYGQEENVLHFLFKMAWLNAPKLPIFSSGNSKIPLIHVDALAEIVFQIMNEFPANNKYIVAVEQSPTTLKQIVMLLAKKLGSGKTVTVKKEEAFTYPEIKQKNYDMLTLNLNIIPGYIVHSMQLKSLYELTFAENIDAVILEYRTSRNLMPLKIFMHGPPASGKSYLSQRLAEYYKLHHLHVKEVIESGIRDIRNRIQKLMNAKKNVGKTESGLEEMEEVEDEEEDWDVDDDGGKERQDLDSLIHLLNEIEESMARNERHRLDEHLVIRLFKRRMLSNPCQNQGFIIDGYPKTLEDTKYLYEPDDTVEYDDEDDISRLYNKKIMPEFVFSLDASDEYLIERVIRMPLEAVQNTHYEEEEMCRRLVEYRALNTDDNTPLIYYDELDVWPTVYSLNSERNDDNLDFTFRDIVAKVGIPRNYDPNYNEEKEQMEKERLNEKYMEQVRMRSKQIMMERREKMENWMFLKNQEKEMEERALALLAMPLRQYLMKYIFPTLTRGLVEVARVRPPDPVDYLAEFLFKENPEGKMFHPNYDNLDDEIDKAKDDIILSGEEQEPMEERKQYSIDESAIQDALSNITEMHKRMSNISQIPTSKLMNESKHTGAPNEKEVNDHDSSGSCTCPPSTARKSESLESSSTPPPPSMCTCPQYSQNGSSESEISVNSNRDNRKKDKYVSCKCPH